MLLLSTKKEFMTSTIPDDKKCNKPPIKNINNPTLNMTNSNYASWNETMSLLTSLRGWNPPFL